MSYIKQIAVIKGIQDGFSADGGALSGLVKCERYGRKLTVSISLINFAPLTEGRYVCALSDGRRTEIFDNREFEGESNLDISSGFAALVCYVNNKVSAIASAICGGFGGNIADLKRAVEKSELIKPDEDDAPIVADTEYRDDAIAEVNYYEYEQAPESKGYVRADKKQENTGADARENETDIGAPKKRAGKPPFYKRVQSEVDGILRTYGRVEELEKIYENSRWVRIDYNEGKFYVFGVLYDAAVPRYFAYGVPAESELPPESLSHLATFLPVGNGRGYWIMYQSAKTGDSIIPKKI